MSFPINSLSPPRQTFSRILLLLCVALTWSTVCQSSEPIRIWVDASGRYSVKASLVRRDGDLVILRRKDGGQSSMPFDRISSRDQEYLAGYEERMQEVVQSPVTLPTATMRYEPLEQLDLPPASFVAAENSPLQMGVVTETTTHLSKPDSITPDPSPNKLKLPLAKLAVDDINPYDRCSDLIPVGTADDPAVGMSVTVGFTLRGSKHVNRVVKFDLAENKTKIIYQSEKPVTLLDHHSHSRQSLVLVDHTSSGQGGSLAIATGWRSDEISLSYQRRLPGDEETEESFGRSRPTLRWARWIDEEHVVAIVDRSLVAWNLVSGEMIYRIDAIEPSSTPALSGGRRYLALPVSGGVQIFDSENGKSLGRVAVEPRVVPSVGFSPFGSAVAISSRRRLVVWDLPNATETVQFESPHSLGSGAPSWVDPDLILTSSGMLVSVQRHAAVWRYHLTGINTLPAEHRIALFRKRPTELTIVEIPHEGADNAIAWFDSRVGTENNDLSKIPGRSVWNGRSWQDQDVRISSSGKAALK